MEDGNGGPTLDMARVTEQAAIAAARLRGRGDEEAADRAAVDAMHAALDALPISGRIVVGEGDSFDAPKLFIGETVGRGEGPQLDVAAAPLEGTTICAKALSNALSVVAFAEAGNLLKTPDIYMEKIAIGPGYAEGLVSLEATPAENLEALAKAKGVPIHEITACILDRARHAKLIAEVRAAGAAIRLIGDGDIAGVIQTTDPEETGIDIYMGIGGAPEGVLAAAALRCTGGQMQGRLHPMNADQKRLLADMGIADGQRIYNLEDMAKGDVLFAATGVTDGAMLDGVRFRPGLVTTHTVLMRAATRTVHWIRTEHRTDTP